MRAVTEKAASEMRTADCLALRVQDKGLGEKRGSCDGLPASRQSQMKQVGRTSMLCDHRGMKVKWIYSYCYAYRSNERQIQLVSCLRADCRVLPQQIVMVASIFCIRRQQTQGHRSCGEHERHDDNTPV